MFQKCVRNVCLKFIFENNYEKKKCFNLNKWQFFKTTLCVLYVVKDKKKHGQPNLQYHKHHAMLTKKICCISHGYMALVAACAKALSFGFAATICNCFSIFSSLRQWLVLWLKSVKKDF